MSEIDDLDYDTEKYREIINKIDDLLTGAKTSFFNNQTTIKKALIKCHSQIVAIRRYLNETEL